MKTVILASIGLAGLAYAQEPPKSLKDSPVAKSHLQGLLDRASAKYHEGVTLRRQKRYGASEAACEAAIDILKNAPFAQFPPNNELAQTYLAEGQYDLALKTWRPWFQADGDVAMVCGTAIIYARTGRLEEAAELARGMRRQWKAGFSFLDVDEVPMTTDVTPDSVEATALMVWATAQWTPPESMERIRRAMQLAPKNGAAIYEEAWLEQVAMKKEWSIPELKQAYRFGGAKVRQSALLWLTQVGIKPADLPAIAKS